MSEGVVVGARDVSFDDDVKLHMVERLPKMAGNQKVIIAFVNLDEKGAPKMKTAPCYTLLVQNGHPQNMVLRAPDPAVSPDLANRCLSAWGEPRTRFVTTVFRYNTDHSGQYMSPLSGKVFAYQFASDKFPLFQEIHREWGLQNVDVQLYCQEANFQ